jgi:hypothetical protein
MDGGGNPAVFVIVNTLGGDGAGSLSFPCAALVVPLGAPT